jgi:hypothetical protein
MGKARAPVSVLAPPGLLRCLILSWSDQRAERLRQIAEREAWDTVVCGDTGKFLKHVFREKIPLTLIDLPEVDGNRYPAFQGVTAKLRDVSESLLIICGAEESVTEETWARELGVWAYVPDAAQLAELDWLFVEARKAVAQRASARVDSPAIQITTEAHLRLDGRT